MIKKLLLTTLLLTTLFSYEIVIDKTSEAPRAKWGDTFTRNDAKELVVNNVTGLMWQDNSAVKSVKKNWQDAKGYCENLTLAGYSDWHLPSIKELETLADTTKVNPAIKDGFKNVTSSGYWSSSSSVSDSKNAWNVLFQSGFSGNFNKTNEYYVRCARAGQ
ncbi:DUF1566 domain-containing protein [Sulfurimonas sp.]|jgi:hypothetical protein|uniref:Lcl C-terminal domain-containing protein n=1 Tax=Sulfurimonas sp. TaxID=2022749 RepID=UPI0025E7E52F|nr:DUF1566 domain-containing protein [Sulfurimonas sp.]MBT5934343.1 DUF1566 domain-containing protein [Sulfurimonas sp.]